VRNIALDARAEQVPIVLLPVSLPVLIHSASGTGTGLVYRVETLPVDSTYIAFRQIVDHHLVSVTGLIGTQKQTSVTAPIRFHFKRDFEIPIAPVGQQNPTIAGRVLGSHQDSAARGPAFGISVVVHLADVPVFEIRTVEDGLESR